MEGNQDRKRNQITEGEKENKKEGMLFISKSRAN